MPEIEVLLPGFSINTDQATLGLCTVTLVRGDKLTVVDVGHFGRRAMLVDTLRAHGIEPEDIGRVILTHARPSDRIIPRSATPTSTTVVSACSNIGWTVATTSWVSTPSPT